MTRVGGCELGLVDRGRRDLLLAQAPLPAALDQGHPHVRTGAPPSGASAPATASATIPHATTTTPTGEGPPAPCRRAHDHEASVATATPPAQTPAVIEEGAAEAGQLRPAGRRAWPRNTPPRGSPPKGQVMRSASASVQAPTKAGARPRRGGVSGRGRGEEERLDQDEHDGAVPVEGAGPGQPDGVAAQAGQPAGPDPGPQPQAAQAPVEQPGSERAERPPPEGWERQRQQDAGRDRGGGHAAPARQADHNRARAAARPLAMQAGMPTPW